MRRILGFGAAVAALTVWAAVPAAAAAGWSQQATPNPPVSVHDGLSAVWCASASACTAVGFYDTSAGNQFGLVEHWNGSTWTVQSNPSGHGELAGVACTSAASCIAVGSAGPGSALLAESWNGTRWTAQPVPVPSGASSASLNGVECSGAASCLAAGTFAGTNGVQHVLIERWNGSTWSVQAVPSRAGQLYGISCLSAASCFAVGTDGVTGLVLAEHWNGSSWVVQGTPALPHIEGGPPASAQLSGVSCSGTVCMATGSLSGPFSTPESTPVRTLGELWNGAKWVLQTTPDAGAGTGGSGGGTAELNGVSCVSATSCTATGAFTSDNDFPVIVMAARWNGTKWANVAITDPSGGGGSSLNAVSCRTTACTAVGYYDNASHVQVSLAERN